MGKDICKHLTDKGLVTRIHKELSKLIRATNNPIFTMSKRFNRPVIKEIWMANMPMKSCSTPLILRGIIMKPGKRYHYKPIGIIQDFFFFKSTKPGSGKDVEQPGLPHTFGAAGNAKLVSLLGNTWAVSSLLFPSLLFPPLPFLSFFF